MRDSLHVAVIATAITVGVLLSGCTTLPEAAKVKKFGDAVASSSAMMSNAITANTTIAVRTAQEREAVKYIRRQPFSLRLESSASPDLIATEETREAIETIQDQLDALQDYGAALALAADQGVVDQLEQASVNLGEAAGELVYAASPIASPVVGPALKLGSRLVGFGLGNAYAGEIQSIIRARDPTVQRLAAEMAGYMEDTLFFIDIQLRQYPGDRSNALRVIQEDRKIDRLRLYKEFKAARSDVDTVMANRTLVANAKAVFQSLAKAHGALATNDVDAEKLVKKFAVLVGDAAAVFEAIEKGKED